MNDLNQLTLTGRLTRDPEMRTTNSGMSILNFAIAVNRKAAGDREDYVYFIDCKVFGKFAEVIANVIRKGSPVALTGRLEQERWEAQDGGARSKIVVVVDQIINTQPKTKSDDVPRGDTGEADTGKAVSQTQSTFIPGDEKTEDVPF